MRRRASRTFLAGAAVALPLLAVPAAAGAHAAHCEEPPDPRLATASLRLTELLTIGEMTAIEAAPGEPGRVYVAERAGRVTAVEADGRRRTFLDLSAEVQPTVDLVANERGMQSLAFARDYRRSRRLYVFYNDPEGNSVVDEFRATPDFSRADPATRRRLLFVPHSFAAQHYGGQLVTRGRRLLVGLGDAMRPHWAQRRRLYGSIVSLDPRRPRRTLRRIARGVRNPYHFAFDPFTGHLLVADVGGDLREELTILPRRRFGRANLGWPYREGHHRLRRWRRPRDYVAPAYTYTHRVGAAIIGGRTIRDPRLPWLRRRYLHGDLCHGWIATARLHRRPRGARRTGLLVGYPTAFGEDSARRLYVAAATGELYRLDPAP